MRSKYFGCGQATPKNRNWTSECIRYERALRNTYTTVISIHSPAINIKISCDIFSFFFLLLCMKFWNVYSLCCRRPFSFGLFISLTIYAIIYTKLNDTFEDMNVAH